VIGAAEGIVNLPQIPYGAATGEELPWYQSMKNSADYLKFKTPDYEKTGQLFDTKELQGVEDFFDPSRYNFNKNNVQGAVLQGLESITSFLAGSKGIGAVSGIAGSAAKGAGLIEGGGAAANALAGTTNASKIAQGFTSSYMINYDEALTAAENAGLEGQDKYAFASVATIPTAILEIALGTEGIFLKNQLARNGKNEMFESLAKGISKDTEGKLTKEGLEGLYNATTSAANKLNSTFAGQVAGNIVEEAGTEAAQAFALNAAKNIYDSVKGEEKFKTNPFSLESFGEYVNNALAGGLGAGGPAAVAVSQKRAVEKAEKQSNNAYETIKKGPEAVSAFKADIDNSVKTGDLTPEQGEMAKFKVDAYNEYYQQTKDLDLKDEDRKKAFELSFNIQGIKTEIPTSEADIEKLSPIERAKVQGKKEIVKGLQKELDEIILKESVKKETTVGPDTVNKIVKNEEKKAEQTPLTDLQARYGKSESDTQEQPEAKPERSERRNNAPKFDQKDEGGNFEFNKQRPLEKKEILHDYFDEHPELNNELEGFIEGGQNNVWHVNLGGTNRYIQFGNSILADKYIGKKENFPAGMETIIDSDGREHKRFKDPVGVRLESIKADEAGREMRGTKGDRLRVLNIYNKATGEHIAFGKEKEKGDSKYSKEEIKQLQAIQKTIIGSSKEQEAVKTEVKPIKQPVIEQPKQKVIKPVEIKISDSEKGILLDEGYTEKDIKASEKTSNDVLALDNNEFATELEKKGLFNSVGNLDSWRPNIGLPTAEFKSGLKNLKAGKVTVASQRISDFLDKIKETGTVNMVGLSGGMTEKFNMPLHQFLLGEKSERELTKPEVKEELEKEMAREESFAETGKFYKKVDKKNILSVFNSKSFKTLQNMAGASHKETLEYVKSINQEEDLNPILEKLLNNVDKLPGKFGGIDKYPDKSFSALGFYDPNDGNVYVTSSASYLNEDGLITLMIHEYIHAYTLSALKRKAKNKSEYYFTKRMENAFNEFKSTNLFKGEYGFKNIEEFVSEIMSNRSFVDKLKSDSTSLWNKIVKYISQLMGIGNFVEGVFYKDKKAEKRVEEIIKDILEFVDESNPITSKDYNIVPKLVENSKRKPFKNLEEMSAKDLSKKLTMSLEAYRDKVLGRSLEQIRKDLQFIDSALEDDKYDEEQKKQLTSIRDNIKKEEKRDAAKWFAYKEDVEMLSSVLSEQRLEDMTDDKLIEAYNLMTTGDFQDEAKNSKLDQLKKQIAYRMFAKRKGELKEYDKFVEEMANKRDISAKDVLMKTLSHMTENQPELQTFSKMFDDAHFDMQSDRYDLKTQLEKLGKEVIKEKNKKLGLKDKSLDVFSTDSVKYFQYLEHPDGRYYTLEEAKEKGFTPSQTKFLKFMLELNGLRNEQLGKTGTDEVNTDILKVDKGVKEAFKTEGILQAFSSYIGNGFNVKNVRINYKGVPTAYGDIEQKLIKESKTLVDKTKALAEMAYYQLQARRQLKKGVNVDEAQNPLLTKENGEYNLSTDGRLKSKFNKPRDKDRGYSKDFYRAAHEFIDDYTHVKHMSPLLPYIQSIEHINKMGFKEHGVKNNVAEWVKQWTDLHIFKKDKPGALGPELDVFMKMLRKLTSLTTMAFNYPAGAWNLTMGIYNNIRSETLATETKGLSRLFYGSNRSGNGVVNKKALEILRKYQVVSIDYDSNPKLFAGRLFDALAHGVTRAGEFTIQGSLFLGLLTEEEWNSFELKKNKDGVEEIHVKDGVNEKKLKDKLISYKNRISDIQGKYGERERRNFQAGEFGKIAIQLKLWALDWWKERFGERYIDRDGVEHSGSWRTFVGQGLADLRADIKEEGVKAIWNNKQAMANLKGAMFVAVFLSLRLGGDDDKDKRKAGDDLDKALGNLLFVFDPKQLKFTLQNPVPAVGTITRFVDALDKAIYKSDFEGAAKSVGKGLPYNKAVSQVAEFIEDDNG
jgi:uncharacterized protein YfkK (UPF0435 family)